MPQNMSENQNSKKILLLGTHGQFNWGDEILLETFLYNLGKNNQYFVNSYKPEDTKNKNSNYNLEVFHTTADVWKLPWYILRADIIFFGGGSILKELYKSVGRNKFSTLWMIFGMVFFSRYFGDILSIFFGRKRIVMSNIGIGVVDSKFGQGLVRRILNMTNFAYFRDQESYAKAQKFGTGKNGFGPQMGVVPDAVFSRTRASLGLPEALYNNIKPTKLKVALNLNYDIANRENWEYFLATLATGLKQINNKYDIEWVGLPMQTAFNPNHDIKVLKEFGEANPELKLQVFEPKTSQELYNFLDSCDLVAAERLHSLILSGVVGKPVFALDYDIKVKSLCKYLEIENYAVDINTKFEKEELVQKIEAVLSDLTGVGGRLDKVVKTKQDEAISYFDDLKNKLGLK